MCVWVCRAEFCKILWWLLRCQESNYKGSMIERVSKSRFSYWDTDTNTAFRWHGVPFNTSVWKDFFKHVYFLFCIKLECFGDKLEGKFYAKIYLEMWERSGYIVSWRETQKVWRNEMRQMCFNAIFYFSDAIYRIMWILGELLGIRQGGLNRFNY